MNVGEVCNREVVFIRPDETLLEAARRMRQRHVGDLVIAEERSGKRYPIGVLTDRDLVIEILAREADPEAITAGDLADPDALLTVQSGDDLLHALAGMRSRGVRRMPVVDRDGALVGILTMDDVLELLSEQMNDLVKLVARQRQREAAVRAN